MLRDCVYNLVNSVDGIICETISSKLGFSELKVLFHTSYDQMTRARAGWLGNRAFD